MLPARALTRRLRDVEGARPGHPSRDSRLDALLDGINGFELNELHQKCMTVSLAVTREAESKPVSRQTCSSFKILNLTNEDSKQIT